MTEPKLKIYQKILKSSRRVGRNVKLRISVRTKSGKSDKKGQILRV